MARLLRSPAHPPAPATIREINCFDANHHLFFASPMDVQLAQLRTLEVIARHGSFSRAARELHLTQPAVSMQVRQLERGLGLPLLERVGKRAFPTRAGEVLLAHAARAFRELETGVAHVQQLRGVVAGRVRLGTSASISVYLLPLALRKFRARFPDIDLVVVTGLAPDITRGVVANELDVGLVSLPVRDRQLAVTPFYRDRLVAIAPPERPWRRRGPARATELAAAPLILFDQGSTVRRMIDAWFHRARLVPRPAMELGNTEAMKRFVEAGMGLSITSEFSVKADVAAGRLVARPLDPPVLRQIGLVRRRDKPLAPPLAAVLQALDDLRRRLARP
jgi:DNA-binding transcriptional LysR family regulator